MKIRIRRLELTPPNIMVVHDLDRVCLPHDRPFYPTEGAWWYAEVNGELAGYAGVVPSKQWADCGYMNRAGVLPEHRGKGLQKRLIRTRQAYARRVGWRWLVTDTRDNPASSNSLIACGFRLYTPSSPWALKDSLYWRYKCS